MMKSGEIEWILSGSAYGRRGRRPPLSAFALHILGIRGEDHESVGDSSRKYGGKSLETILSFPPRRDESDTARCPGRYFKDFVSSAQRQEKTYKGEVDALKTQLGETQRGMQKKEDEIFAAHETISMLEDQLEQERKNRMEAEGLLQLNLEERNRLYKENSSLKRQLNTLQSRYSFSQFKIQALKRQWEDSTRLQFLIRLAIQHCESCVRWDCHICQALRGGEGVGAEGEGMEGSRESLERDPAIRTAQERLSKQLRQEHRAMRQAISGLSTHPHPENRGEKDPREAKNQRREKDQRDEAQEDSGLSETSSSDCGSSLASSLQGPGRVWVERPAPRAMEEEAETGPPTPQPQKRHLSIRRCINRLSMRFITGATMKRFVSTVSALKPLVEDLGVKRRHPGTWRSPCIRVPDPLETAANNLVQTLEMQPKKLMEEGKQLYAFLRGRHPPAETDDLQRLGRQVEAKVLEDLGWAGQETLEQRQMQKLKAIVSRRLKIRAHHWQPISFDLRMGMVYLTERFAPEFAALTAVFAETKRQDPDFSPKYLFDLGSGLGSVTWAADAAWPDSLREHFCVDPCREMNDLASLLTRGGDPDATPCIPHVFHRQFLPASSDRTFDLVVSAYSLLELPDIRSRVQLLENLWRKASDYMIFLELGTNAGFATLLEVRDFVLEMGKRSGTPVTLVAPCPHTTLCPRLGAAKFTPCNFPVRYFPLDYGEHRDAQSEVFSYLVFKKGSTEEPRGPRGEPRGPHEEARWPRVVRPVLTRSRHAVCRLCTPQGTLEEIISTQSKHGKEMYRLVRWADWGDRLPVEALLEGTSGEPGREGS
ncbi:unnamed protein product [Darwinula stevensoni]|uniref:Methyltransferase-like protein 17, mitochondrial n=1 Tax=Darwinula stevensoni TaxID=69355 RepID=A0A7R9AAV5_9CRUS|nr:unnamed protein product [Darwinula stevensoni]CAG0898375.1 unnamed protein product [Darwinula stevensoni]